MGYIENPVKKQARENAYYHTSLAGREILLLLDEIDSLTSRLDCTVGGIPSGMGSMMTRRCQLAVEMLTAAQLTLSRAQSGIIHLNIREWVPDEEWNG